MTDFDPAGDADQNQAPEPDGVTVRQDRLERLSEAYRAVDYPDEDAIAAARARQDVLTKPAGSLGWLEELAAWFAGAQGQCPPHDFHRARLVIFAGDHGIAQAGVSAYPPEVTAQMVATFTAGGAAANVLADVAGVGVRVEDLSVDADTPEELSRYKIRRSSGRIDIENALSIDESLAAVMAGMDIADAEIDAGADLLIAGDMGIGNTTVAAALVSVLLDVEPIKVIGRGSGIDDQQWMAKCAAIRDARRRAWPHREDLVELMACCGGADLAAMAGFLLRAAGRRTPVLLDGLVVTAAALAVHRSVPRLTNWLQAAHRSVEPAHPLALTRLGLTPMLDLGMRLGEGSGALAAVPLLRSAVRTLAEMSTFEQASVSGRITHDPDTGRIDELP